jgi:hypothetical protein
MSEDLDRRSPLLLPLLDSTPNLRRLGCRRPLNLPVPIPEVLEVLPRKVLKEAFNWVRVVEVQNEEWFVFDDLTSIRDSSPFHLCLLGVDKVCDPAMAGMIKATRCRALQITFIFMTNVL